MKTSKWRMFRKLYLKDLQSVKMEMLIFIAAVAVWNIFLYYKSISGWEYEMSLGLSTIAFGIAAFTPFIQSFKLLQNEWKHNTVYMIMTLPISGNMFLLSKLAVIISQYIIFGLVSVIGFLLLSFTTPICVLTCIGIIVGMIFATVLAFFSSVIGKLVKRFSGLTTLITFLVSGYIFARIIELLASGLDNIGIPGIQISTPDYLPGMAVTIALPFQYHH